VDVWTASASPEARNRCHALGADRVVDRATQISQLMEFCTAHAKAQARSAGGSRFPPPQGPVLRAALFAN
jgi:hypothetical protein